MARPFPWKCNTCGERQVRLTLVPDYTAELEHDGRSYSVTVPDLQVLECSACKTLVLTDEAHKRLGIALRDKAGLLRPAEIRAKRDELGLTQKQLASLLKVADTTVSRWETGAQIQQRAMDLLLRAFFNVPALRQFLGMGSPVSALTVATRPPDTSAAKSWTGSSVPSVAPSGYRDGFTITPIR
jgi:putative zinc finger/helix-turn-helix YgiT family protein